MTSATSPPESGPFSFEVGSSDAPLLEAPASIPLSFEVAAPDPLSFDAPSSVAFSFDAPSPSDFSLELPPPIPDRRVQAREVLRVQARICLDGEPPLEVHTVDLSSHGLAITSKQPLNVNQECTVELGISVPEIARAPSLRASVRYCARLHDDQFRIGMKFTTVSVEAAELIVAVLGL
jgi:hypothetical protein